MRYLIFILASFCAFTALAQDLVEFRSVGRTGVYNEAGLLKSWKDEGPELFLKIEGIGKGYSQAVLYKDIIFVTGIQDDTIDVLSSYELNGELKWQRPYGRSWIRSYSDTRATPTIENNRIYLGSGMGEVVCIDASTGDLIWSVNAFEKYSGEYQRWGIAESPLLTDKAVIYSTGGDLTTVIALKKETGELLWKTRSLGGPSSYASSVLINRNGKNIILAQSANDFIAIDANNGNLLWNFNLEEYHPGRMGKGANTNPPLCLGNDIFITSGYNHTGLMLSTTDDYESVSLKWKNDTLDTHHGGVVLIDGNLYGSNWLSNGAGNWVSLNWETGKVNWEKEWFNKGSIISADGLLYCYEEKQGNIALVKPSPEDFKIISSFKIEDGKGPHWAHPAIFDKKLFIRHGDVLMIYNIEE